MLLFIVSKTVNAFEMELDDVQKDVILHKASISQIKDFVDKLSISRGEKKQAMDALLGEIASLTIVFEVQLLSNICNACKHLSYTCIE